MSSTENISIGRTFVTCISFILMDGSLCTYNSVYTDTGVRVTDDIDDAGFAVLILLLSVTWYFCGQYNNSNMPDTCGLFPKAEVRGECPLRGSNRLGPLLAELSHRPAPSSRLHADDGSQESGQHPGLLQRYRGPHNPYVLEISPTLAIHAPRDDRSVDDALTIQRLPRSIQPSLLLREDLSPSRSLLAFQDRRARVPNRSALPRSGFRLCRLIARNARFQVGMNLTGLVALSGAQHLFPCRLSLIYETGPPLCCRRCLLNRMDHERMRRDSFLLGSGSSSSLEFVRKLQ